MRGSESCEVLLENEQEQPETNTMIDSEIIESQERSLTQYEKRFLLCAERGDCATVRRY